MDSAQSQLTEKLTSANNILVTVNRDPTVDQLAACIGLTLLLNKLNKHATAVFSGEVPSTLEFLQPEGTIEKNTDSLRDFIIAIDKSKADKLRYKVEDQLVRIFITPYRTSITEKDLEFSQGDFNVDLVIALGVQDPAALDGAITAHGRILHDATVTSVNLTSEGGLGSINWHEPSASSLCELIVELSHTLGEKLMDGQIATALLTGIVSETERFRNEKTTPLTMSLSAELLSAGADQQLVAQKLEQPVPEVVPPQETSEPTPEADEAPADDDDKDIDQDAIDSPEPPKPDDGTLEIEHSIDQPVASTTNEAEPESDPESAEATVVDPPIELIPAPSEASDQLDTPDDALTTETSDAAQLEPDNLPRVELTPGAKLIVDPPLLGGTLTANSQPEQLESALDPLGPSHGSNAPILDRSSNDQPVLEVPVQPQPVPPVLTGFTPPPPAWVPPPDDVTSFVPPPLQEDAATDNAAALPELNTPAETLDK
jgi:hypothetical protein